MPLNPPAVVWFRHDLRLTDNPALAAAVATGRPIVPVYVRDDEAAGRWAPGGASRWWLHRSLAALARGLRERGAGLILRSGNAPRCLAALVEEIGAREVFANRGSEPWLEALDGSVEQALRDRGAALRRFEGGILFEPESVRTRTGDAFSVFTPFWRRCLELPEPAPPVPAPASLRAPSSWPVSERLHDWQLLPNAPDWAGGLLAAWTPGEEGAARRLDAFLDGPVHGYASGRDRPDLAATSRLSPHLRLGEIGPRQVWHGVRAAAGRSVGAEKFLTELGWREFSHHLLRRAPTLPEQGLRPEFARFPWASDARRLRAWQRGRTGYPIVDAGMRELWATGWIHNRVRMIAASFLVKDLLIPWQEGEAWFWDTLVDADLASNAAGWQWVAGCGADAAPYFRIFNPVLQGERFDPAGAYVRRWIPEIARLPDRFVHRPWQAPDAALREAGVVPGETYPLPIIDHHAARARALAAFATLKEAAS